MFLNHKRQAFESEKNSQQAQKNELDRAKYGQFKAEIEVDNNLVRLVIGKGGSNIKELEKRYGVRIIVDKDEKERSNKKKITVIGPNQDTVEEARDEVNL